MYVRIRIYIPTLVSRCIIAYCTSVHYAHFSYMHMLLQLLVLTCCSVRSATLVSPSLLLLSSQEEARDEARSSAQDKVDKFLASQGSILSKPIDPFKGSREGEVWTGWWVVRLEKEERGEGEEMCKDGEGWRGRSNCVVVCCGRM